MTFAIEKQILLNNRIYNVESISVINGQAFADATYRINCVTHQVECDDVRIMLAKRVRN